MKMTKMILCLAVGSVFTLYSCKRKTFTSEKVVAKITLYETANPAQIMGNATFFSKDENSIKMELEIKYPKRANSSVAVHFHEHGDCGEMGNNAHGHWNPTKENHGKWGSNSFHSGDIGNIVLDANGIGKVIITTNRWNVTPNDSKNIVGLSIIVHGGVDDYTTQPTGNSGPRVGCGVILASN